MLTDTDRRNLQTGLILRTIGAAYMTPRDVAQRIGAPVADVIRTLRKWRKCGWAKIEILGPYGMRHYTLTDTGLMAAENSYQSYWRDAAGIVHETREDAEEHGDEAEEVAMTPGQFARLWEE